MAKKEFKCKLCPKSFDSLTKLKIHFKGGHRPKKKPPKGTSWWVLHRTKKDMD